MVLYNLAVGKGKRVEQCSFAYGFDLGNSFRSCSYLNVKLNKMLRTYMYNVVGDHIKGTIKKHSSTHIRPIEKCVVLRQALFWLANALKIRTYAIGNVTSTNKLMIFLYDMVLS